MITLTAKSESYGNTNQYIARISGRDPKFTFRREFTGQKDRSVTRAFIDEPSLYEVGDIDKKGRKTLDYWLIVTRPESCPAATETSDPDLIIFLTDAKDVAVLAKRVEQGECLDEIIEILPKEKKDGYLYRIRSSSQAKRASETATTDQAIDACWTILQAFPERQAKKILASLKLRISPKPVPVAEPNAEVMLDQIEE